MREGRGDSKKGHTGPYTTKIESVDDICVGRALLAAGLGLCLFQGVGGVQDGILRHRAAAVCTGSACGLITVFGREDEDEAGGIRKRRTQRRSGCDRPWCERAVLGT
jgi:hypothetical protein